MTKSQKSKRSKRGNLPPQSNSGAPDRGWDASQSRDTRTVESGFVIRSMPLFGYQTRRSLQYFSNQSIAGTNTAGTYVFSANGLFDPDITGTGGQPMGFDQIIQFFNHYTVMRARIRVTFSAITGGGLISMCALSLNGSSTPVTVVEDLIENGDIQVNVLGFAGAYGSQVTMTKVVDLGKFQGLRNTIDDPDMRGDAASNPSEQVYFHLSVWDPEAVTSVSASAQVLIEYDTIFHEPRKAPLS